MALNSSDRRTERLAQAAQVGDLMADRAGQLLEALELELELAAAPDPLTGPTRRERLAENLRRSVAAYLELRDPS